MGKRGLKSSSEGFAVSKKWCVSGGSCKQPVALPVKVVDTKECVLVSAYDGAAWLPSILSGQCRGVAVDVVREVQEVIMAQLHGSAAEAADSVATPPYQLCRSSSDVLAAAGDEEAARAAPDAARAAPNSGRKGRDALGLDEDTDEEDLFHTPTKMKSRAAAKVALSWTTVVLDDVPIMVRKIEKGRGFLIPVEDDLEQLLLHLEKKVKEGGSAQRSRRELRPGTPERTCADKAKIRWSFGTDSWEICYTDEEGKKHRKVAGFNVPRSDVDGKMLSADEYKQMRLRVLQRARRQWNSLDKSSDARFELADE